MGIDSRWPLSHRGVWSAIGVDPGSRAGCSTWSPSRWAWGGTAQELPWIVPCNAARASSPPSQSHQRQHNKDKPYKCPNCYRAYSDSASLQIHLSAHAIKHAKAYCCSMCGRAYTSVSVAGGVGSRAPAKAGMGPEVPLAGFVPETAHAPSLRQFSHAG